MDSGAEVQAEADQAEAGKKGEKMKEFLSKNKVWIIIGLIALIGFWGFSARNSFISMDENINASWAQVENQLKRRYDLIPNLVNTIKGITKQEQEVFGKIADSRAKLAGAKTTEDKIKASKEMEGAISRLLMVAENYPQLRSVESFNRLMDELAGTENRISVERQRYNENVQLYNKSLKLFPKNIIANFMGLSKKPYFEISEKESQNVDVKF